MTFNLKKRRYKNDKIFLEIVDSDYLKSTDYSKPVVIETLRYLDDLNNIYVDPFAYFKNKAKIMEDEKSNINTNIISRNSPEINPGSFLPLQL